MTGRRRPDTKNGDLPPDLVVGDYWKVLHPYDGQPLKSDHPGNLTGTVWYVLCPSPTGEKGYIIAYLRNHTVREHEDGTISVRPGDGTSNSILCTGRQGQRWHGYIDHGVFQEDP